MASFSNDKYLIPYDEEAVKVMDLAARLQTKYKNLYLMPEHVLLSLFQQKKMLSAVSELCDCKTLKKEATAYLKENAAEFASIWENKNDEVNYESVGHDLSSQCKELMTITSINASCAHQHLINPAHLLNAIYQLKESNASYILQKNMKTNYGNLLSKVMEVYKGGVVFEGSSVLDMIETVLGPISIESYQIDEDHFDAEEIANGTDSDDDEEWKSQLLCISDSLDGHNPLIGREAELDRTIQILCRKDKNNPLHIGEPGVGKTAIVYGLAKRIKDKKVPKRLAGYKIYELNLGNLVAGSQFRGDFENKIKELMEGVCRDGKAIVYIDEIHNLVGAGRAGGDSLDASNMLKPYLEGGIVRFIGSTTYEEYNKYFSKDKALVRRFQQIDIVEPTVDEAIKILMQLKGIYEDFHHVFYEDEAVEYAVRASAEFISDRFLPDKAIDLIDEAGAYAETHLKTKKGETPTITKMQITALLNKVCKIDAKALTAESNASLETMETDILSKIYGQDDAVHQLVEAVQLSKAGLSDETKPMASLLFVGPTGVGKTELCKVLAETLGISLIRFDMSEYAEKHTIAKLIGSPAGYVGYDDGGLLTDAINKTPNCVLLLDEIEKAHPDIFNILLQVMDYAKLTDNKGRKADFRHVVLVMTSNAGAQFAHMANIGFGSHGSSGTAMLTQVKKTFKPEFINRLNDIVVFNDMDEKMATLILNKKIKELQKKLKSKNITLKLTKETEKFLLSKGYSKEYGAREMDRAIRTHLTTILTKEILFGRLKDGGKATAVVQNDKITIE